MDELLATSTATDTPNSWRIPRLPLVNLPKFDLHRDGGQHRGAVESYIHARFNRVHGAEITHFLSDLISLKCGDGYSAAVGLASAGESRLFAEIYLPAAIEKCIGASVGTAIDRRQILEIGNLVSTWKGSSLLLFIFLSELIERLGFHWVVFTATREVESLLARMHYAPVVIADADPALLPDGGANWGSYYDHQPRVMFGDVRAAVKMARKHTVYRAAVACIETQIERIRCTYLNTHANEYCTDNFDVNGSSYE